MSRKVSFNDEFTAFLVGRGHHAAWVGKVRNFEEHTVKSPYGTRSGALKFLSVTNSFIEPLGKSLLRFMIQAGKI